MLKTKRNRFVIAIVMLSMVAMYGFMPVANAASLKSAKDVISDSEPSASAVTHTITYRPGVDIQALSVITLTFDAEIDITDATGSCSDGATWASSTNQVTCTAVGEIASTSDHTITVNNASNPGTAGDYAITISHNEDAGESSQILIYIIDDVTMSAHVDASLTFGIATTTDGVSVNGDTTTGTSSPDAINFSTLATGPVGRQIIAQSLTVSTNAAAGFVVTVQQDQALQTGAGADINSYSTTSPNTWLSPAGTLDDDATYGHIALTSDDGDIFGSQEYQGLDGTDPLTVLTHNGPAGGATTGIGQTYVGYSIEITELQEAGDYKNTLTYICTPTF